jgi:hypothetical protein
MDQNARIATAPVARWNYSMRDCPGSTKVLLLTDFGIAIIGTVGSDTRGYIAWSPLPKRDRSQERKQPAYEPPDDPPADCGDPPRDA